MPLQTFHSHITLIIAFAKQTQADVHLGIYLGSTPSYANRLPAVALKSETKLLMMPLLKLLLKLMYWLAKNQ